MQLTLDTNNTGDVEILKALASVLTDGVPAFSKGDVNTVAPAAKKTPAKKAAAAEPDVNGSTLANETPADNAAPGPTMKDAVTLASQLMSKDKTSKVKAALTKRGVSRVSELSEDQLPDFVAALEKELAAVESEKS